MPIASPSNTPLPVTEAAVAMTRKRLAKEDSSRRSPRGSISPSDYSSSLLADSVDSLDGVPGKYCIIIHHLFTTTLTPIHAIIQRTWWIDWTRP